MFPFWDKFVDRELYIFSLFPAAPQLRFILLVDRFKNNLLELIIEFESMLKFQIIIALH